MTIPTVQHLYSAQWQETDYCEEVTWEKTTWKSLWNSNKYVHVSPVSQHTPLKHVTDKMQDSWTYDSQCETLILKQVSSVKKGNR